MLISIKSGLKPAIVLCAATLLAGCLDNDVERGAAGAAAGAVVFDATGNKPVTGAILGGLAGVFCDDAGVCK